MAHELSIRKDGTVEAAFAGTKPWHGLGTMVDKHMTPTEALDKAHLDWTVETRKIQIAGGAGIPDRVANVRSDTGAYLGVVSPSYSPIQNAEQASFIEALTGEGAAVVECVGALKGGRRTFWTCKLPDNLKIQKGDEVERYLVLANGHDGSLAFRAWWSPIRVVCQNTLNAAMRGAASGVSILHLGNVQNRIAEARKILGLADAYYTQVGAAFQAMLDKELEGAEFTAYLDEVFPFSETLGFDHPTTKKIRGQVAANFANGRGADKAGRTVWGAYNAVTEYVSHQREYRGSEAKQAESRFQSVQLTTGRDTQQRAFNAALALVA